MKILSAVLGAALAATALAASTLTSTAMAQAAYKPEYKVSLVLGPPTPWGLAGQAGGYRAGGRGHQPVLISGLRTPPAVALPSAIGPQRCGICA